ncbi:MAG: hypothetical protein ACO2PN_11925 [Pyrobaculum sp.]
MSQRQFRVYVETCRLLGYRFDSWEVGQAAGWLAVEDVRRGLRRRAGGRDAR